jgi:hypothetical protein
VFRNISAIVVFALLVSPLYAQDGPGEVSPLIARETVRPPQQPDTPANQGSEEPDFAFIAGGPYTQPQGSFQIIMAGQWGTRSVVQNGSTLKRSQYATLFRNEWGFADRWELDLIAPGAGERDTLNGSRALSSFAMADSIIGIRYRVLKEDAHPFTLTTGPQLILPTGSVASGASVGTTGYAWDLATAKDWGGPLFIYNSFNASFFPSVADPQGISLRRFTLRNLAYASALGIRALERNRGPGIHHDVHFFVEYGVARAESLLNDAAGLHKTAQVTMVASPGIRYGFMTRYKNEVEQHLLEFGVAFPVGLNSQTPSYGVIVQVQIEHIFARWASPE